MSSSLLQQQASYDIYTGKTLRIRSMGVESSKGLQRGHHQILQDYCVHTVDSTEHYRESCNESVIPLGCRTLSGRLLTEGPNSMPHR